MLTATLGSFDVAVHNQAILGEAPIWDQQTQRLIWVDIIGKSIHFYDPATEEDRAVMVGPPVGSVAPRRSGGLVAATSEGISLLTPNGSLDPLVRMAFDTRRSRMNDGKCDALGRYWTGTMALDHVTPDSSLYKVDPELRVTTMLTGVVVSNGLGWSPDNSKLYYNDTIARYVEAFNFDLADGTIWNRRHLIDFSEGPGVPDGMAVDAEGCLWIAAWGGWCIRRYQPDGALDRIIELPVAKVTSCCFGSKDLSELYVTTSRHELAESDLARQPLAGSLFRFEPGVQGLPTGHFAG